MHFVTMTEYENNIPVEVAFPAETIEYPLARIISEAGLKQLHLAETEKYAHVTYFFNGGREQAYEGEDHVLIPSPVVPSYDQKPEMSARAVTDRFLQEIRTGKYDFCVINFANADMLAHLGNIDLVVKGIEKIDEALGLIYEEVKKQDGVLIITSDHGNAESLVYSVTGERETKHNLNPVPFYLISDKFQGPSLYNEAISGILPDVAPTILEIMKLPAPAEMDGRSLISKLGT